MVRKTRAAPQKRKAPPRKAAAPPKKKARTQEARSEEGDLPKESNPKPAPQKKATPAPKNTRSQKAAAPVEERGSQIEDILNAAEALRLMRGGPPRERREEPRMQGRPQEPTTKPAEAPRQMRGVPQEQTAKAAEALRQMRGPPPQTREDPRMQGRPQEQTSKAAGVPYQQGTALLNKAAPQRNPRIQQAEAPRERSIPQAATSTAGRAAQQNEPAPQTGPRIQKEAPRQQVPPQAKPPNVAKAPEALPQTKQAPLTKAPPQQGGTANPRAPVPAERCWDWMLVAGNTHYAKDRASFIAYRHIARYCPAAMLGRPVLVAGVGTVELKVPSSPNPGSYVRTLVLENVLHLPNAVCNGFSVALWLQASGTCGLGSIGACTGWDKQDLPYWFSLPFHGSERLVLYGNPQGRTYLGDGPKMLSYFFDERVLKKIRDEAF
ncbi:hypothetical protein BJY00DRAFT_315519 [Aspergillus carlsbadensis]|nr:hypothetical protein BJY00DRAFT_315519 [Aspergillus carlsbadensis]